jgi:cell division protein FtsA
VLQEIRRSGYEGLLPAGIVLTGGSAALRGITTIAQKVLCVPARVAMPKNLVGMVETLHNPAYSTGVGLLRWAINGHNALKPRARQPEWSSKIRGIFHALLPEP